MARWGNWRRLKRLSPHDLRRTAITRALDQGLSYRQVQMMSGHKDPKTVMRYDHGRENLERLYAMKLIRPGVTVLERAVSGARRHAQRETWRKIEPLLSKENRKNLDGLLGVEEKYGVTPLTWFRTGATSHSAGAILNALEKITEMRALGVEAWKLSEFNPNRLKLLARIGKKATNQALERMPEQRRYPILVAFLSQTLIETIDEAVDLFDRCLAEADSRAGRELDEFRKSVAKATNEKVNLFQTIGRIILDPKVKDSEVRRIIYQQIAPDHLRTAVDECERIARPLDDSYFDLLGTRYGNLRQFAPRFLETFTWRANQDDDALLAAIEVIRELNAAGGRKLPDDAPINFIPPIWAAYVIEENEQLSRRYYELCLLWQMREALRNGNLWIEGSRRYTNPESYLIPPEDWPAMRTETCRLMRVPEDGLVRFEQQVEDFKLASDHLAGQLIGREKVRFGASARDIQRCSSATASRPRWTCATQMTNGFASK